MTEPTPQSEPLPSRHPDFHLSLQLFDAAGEETCHVPVIVKNLTTGGVVLEVLESLNQPADNYLKGSQGFLLGNGDHDGLLIKVPAKVLWTKKHDEENVATLGLELLKPLPLSMRHALEDNLAVGAKDMKVLWDYWDEMRQETTPEQLVAAPSPAADMPTTPDAIPLPAESPQAEPNHASGWIYGVGFAAILTGVALQYPQSEQLAFTGLVVMFLGSLVVAGKSLSSMWQIFSSQSPR